MENGNGPITDPKNTKATEATPQPSESGELKTFRIKVDADRSSVNSAATFYSNYASVSHSPTEICIDFCLLAPPHKIRGSLNPETEAKEGSETEQVILAPVNARILIPVEMANGLVKAISAQAERFALSKAEGAMGIITQE
jgi:hypothetical protein